MENKRAQVLARPALNMRENPEGRVIRQLACGALVDVLLWQDGSDWAQIAHEGKQGYVLKEYLQQVEEGMTLPVSQEEKPWERDGAFANEFTYSTGSGLDLPYVVMQVTLKEKWIGTGSRNLSELEDVINYYARKGYRLHTMSTSNGGSKGGMMGDRIQATLVFEKKE